MNQPSDLLEHAPALLELLAFRLQPMLVFMLLSPRTALKAKALWLLLYMVLVDCALQLDIPLQRVGQGFAALAFCALMALAVHRLRDLLAANVVSRGALFLFCCCGFQLVPAMLVPDSMVLPALVIGWEMTLAGHSYAVDSVALGRKTSAAECLFFIVVNPTLVFVERGKPIGPPELRPRAVGRIGFGLLTLLAQYAIPAPRVMGALGKPLASYLTWVGTYGGRLVRVAFGHSGLASVQIGAMQLIGWAVPERYAFPLLARSPAEFWRRWNIWIGRWAQRYLFNPLALVLSRATRRQPRVLGKGLAALATFAAVGLWHDVFFYARGLRLGGDVEPWRWTRGFLLFGALFLIWLLLAPRLPAALQREPAHAGLRALRSFASWLLFIHGLLFVLWVINADRGALVFVQ